MPSQQPRVLFLGSKEFPFGSNKGDDPITSGGIESYVDVLAPALAAKGIEVTVVTRRFRSTPAKENVGGVKVERVHWLRGFFLRNPSFNLLSFSKALRVKCDLIHSHGIVAGFFGWVAARLRGKKLVVTPHGIASGQPQYSAVSGLFKLLERFVYKRADAVVFLSEGEKSNFAAKKIVAKHPFIIGSGIDLARFRRSRNAEAAERLKKQLGLQGKTVITFVGRLAAVKGLNYLLEAFAEIAGNDCALLIVGEGPERKALEAQAKELGLGGKALFLGARDDTPAIYAASDVYVQPSLSEGMPMSVAEAMAAGCALLVTRIGLPVEEGIDALVVEPKNAGALAKALEKLCSDAGLRKKIAANAVKSSKKFSIEETVKKHLELYKSLLKA